MVRVVEMYCQDRYSHSRGGFSVERIPQQTQNGVKVRSGQDGVTLVT